MLDCFSGTSAAGGHGRAPPGTSQKWTTATVRPSPVFRNAFGGAAIVYEVIVAVPRLRRLIIASRTATTAADLGPRDLEATRKDR